MAQVVNNLPPRQEIGLISGLEISPEENGYPLQYSSLGEFRGQKSLVGYSSQGSRESTRPRTQGTTDRKLLIWNLNLGLSQKFRLLAGSELCAALIPQASLETAKGSLPGAPGQRTQTIAVLVFSCEIE